MLSKLFGDLANKGEPYKISGDLSSPILGEYYFLFEENPAKLNKLISGFDKDGIPLNKSYIDVSDNTTHYYPISIGQYGLAVFNSYCIRKNNEKKEHFLRIADWFYSNRIENDETGACWLTDVPKPEYKITRPWKSAFSQSRALSILLRAWQLTKNERYLQLSKDALKPFEFSIDDGGVSAFTKHGKFYEEYVADEPTMVLDGHIFSLLGLYDFYRAVTKEIDNDLNSLSVNLFDEGVDSLIKWLPEYDLGFWVRFNMCRMQHYPETDPCTIGYLRLIILQLKLLYRITGKNILNEYSMKFARYDKMKNILRMYPVKYRALKKLNRI